MHCGYCSYRSWMISNFKFLLSRPRVQWNAFLARAYLNIPYVTNPPCNYGCRSCPASSLKLLLAEWLCLSSIHPYPISDVIKVFMSLFPFIVLFSLSDTMYFPALLTMPLQMSLLRKSLLVCLVAIHYVCVCVCVYLPQVGEWTCTKNISHSSDIMGCMHWHSNV